MTLKTLLLGSAAAFAVVGGAQAADLSVAEPVEYVKVCDYFGTGYFYIPGTDTCLKISGYALESANFGPNNEGISGHSSSWSFSNLETIDFTSKSMTEYGELDGVLSFAGSAGGSQRGSTAIGEDGAWLSLGGFKAGAYQLAAWNAVYAVNDVDGVGGSHIYGTFGYDLLNTFQLNWAAGGMSASLAVSDPTTEFGSTLPTNYSIPLITGQLGWSMGGASANVSAGYVGLANGGSWGIDGMLHFNLGKADGIELNGAFGDNAFIQNGMGAEGPEGFQSGAGSSEATNNGYSLLAAWQHVLSPQLAFQLDGSWEKYSGSSQTGYAVNADLVWSPVTNFSATGAIGYSNNTKNNISDGFGGSDVGGAWNATLMVRKNF